MTDCIKERCREKCEKENGGYDKMASSLCITQNKVEMFKQSKPCNRKEV